MPTAWFVIAAIVIAYSTRCIRDSNDNISSNLDSLQHKLEFMYITLDTSNVLEQALAIQEAKLELQKERLRIELEYKKQELFWTNVAFLGVGTLAGFLWLILVLPREIEKKAKMEVDDKLREIIQGRSSALRKLLHEYDYEGNLCANKKIFFLGEDDPNVTDILDEYGLNIMEKKEDHTKCEYDILFINNSQGKYMEKGKESDVIMKVKSLPHNICVFYYNETNIKFPVEQLDSKFKRRINYANSLSQIYGNLLNTLKYQDKISKS